MTEATDEDVVRAKRSLDAGHPLPIGLQVKLLARLERAERDLQTWRRALHSLTPGGSEYADDPQRCVQYVRASREHLFAQVRRHAVG